MLAGCKPGYFIAIIVANRRIMLERLRLFRNKNKNAGQAENAEQNIQKESITEQKEQQTEDKVSSQQAEEDLSK